jgi:hypothetical protein
VLQSKTTHPSSQNVNYGLCNGSGEDLNGNPVCNLCSYSKQDSTEGAESVRHMGADLHDVAKRVFAVAKAAGVLSPATLEQGEFTAVQVRVYDGDIDAHTKLHTDTYVGLDEDGKPKYQIDQVHARRRLSPIARLTQPLNPPAPTSQIENTDVVIYSLGDPMLLWRKDYPDRGRPQSDYAWRYPVVPLEDGSLFVWPTGPETDDWLFKHSVYWPRPADPGYNGLKAGKRRFAFVFRCTRPRRWYGAAWPYRVVVPSTVS